MEVEDEAHADDVFFPAGDRQVVRHSEPLAATWPGSKE
jgi:hypothetical protein